MSTHSCQTRLLLPEALSGRLDPAEEKRVMAHLATCETCQDAAAELEIGLVSLALLRVEREEGARLGTSTPLPDGPTEQAVADLAQARAARRPRLLIWLAGAAAAVILVGAGIGVGYRALPPRDAVHYGASVALTPPAAAADQSAHGTVMLAESGEALSVRLSAQQLPPAGWYECLWISQGQSRSAGSFRATDGWADVDLRVAPPQGSSSWDLQVVAHSGGAANVVLEGTASYPS